MKRRIVFVSMLGNALEWYDYSLYGHFAVIISKLFFPSDNQLVSLISTFAVFACGFLARPLGGIVFGYIGDKYGRRISLASAILMMAVPTALIGLLPGYEVMGIAAPISLVIIRLLQGLSMGGAFSGAMIFTVEHARLGSRGFVGSTSVCSLGIGFLLGSSVASICSFLMSDEAFLSWGWRMPFIFSIFFSFVAFYINSHTTESEIYTNHKASGESVDKPVAEAFKNYKLSMLMGFGVYLTITVPFYTYSVFVNNFIANILHQGLDHGLIVNISGMATLAIIAPIAAYISDKIGRKPVLISACVGMLLFTYPYFKLLSTGDIVLQILAQITFAFIHALYFGPVPAVLVELFPTKVRYTSMSISYNLSVALFGGMLPMVAIWLIYITGNNLAVSYYIIAVLLCSLVTLIFMPETYKKNLE
jgi:MHS family proline/betaine transporter-like MFS transporter